MCLDGRLDLISLDVGVEEVERVELHEIVGRVFVEEKRDEIFEGVRHFREIGTVFIDF